MNSLKEYGDLFLKLNLSELSIQEGNFSLVLKKETSAAVNQPQAVVPASSKTESFSGTEEIEEKNEDDGIAVKAPLLGIFGELSGEREAVKEGDKVKKGDALCTIEAMKMLNEVVAPADGTVTKVCVKPGQLVEYNQQLYAIKA